MNAGRLPLPLAFRRSCPRLLALSLALAPFPFTLACSSSSDAGASSGAPTRDSGPGSEADSNVSSEGGTATDASPLACASPTATLTVVAGNGTLGEVDGIGGTAGTAEFDSPYGITVAPDGTLYVTDWASGAIRKIDPTGNVTTVANVGREFPEPAALVLGEGGVLDIITAAGLAELSPSGSVTCLLGEQNCAASIDLNNAIGLARAPNGNFYVSNTRDFDIVELTAAGVASTFAGTLGREGSTDGPGATALFEQPTGMTIDGAGNLYVSDYGFGTVRKITPADIVTTIAGQGVGYADGTGGSGGTARFMDPVGIAVDSVGNLYVVDAGDRHIRKIDVSGNVTTIAGGAGSLLDSPWGIARFDDQTFYVTDTNANRVVKLSLSCP